MTNKFDKTCYDNFQPFSTDLDGWNGMSGVFKKLIEQIKPKTIIEVGSWKGQSSINMANICKNINLSATIYCVDTWLGALEFWTNLNNSQRDTKQKNGYPQVYYQFLSNVVNEKCEDYIIPVTLPSNIASKYFKYFNTKAQLIYIDGSHEYDDVMLDIQNYYDLLDDGGVIFGDDFNWIDVGKAVEEWCTENNKSYETFDYFWIIKK
jgi:SAM-dependent methyltransferase